MRKDYTKESLDMKEAQWNEKGVDLFWEFVHFGYVHIWSMIGALKCIETA